jgi:hypothetical protein
MERHKVRLRIERLQFGQDGREDLAAVAGRGIGADADAAAAVAGDILEELAGREEADRAFFDEGVEMTVLEGVGQFGATGQGGAAESADFILLGLAIAVADADRRWCDAWNPRGDA